MKENNYKKLIDDGIYELNNGNVEHAIELISKSIELKNDWEISYFYRAVAFHSIQKFDEAIKNITPSMVVFEYLDVASVEKVRKNPTTVLTPIMVLPEK